MPGGRKIISLVVYLCVVAATGGAEEPYFKLAFPGEEVLVDYERYGYFENAGTKDYKYVITNRVGLAKATGSGIDPNTFLTSDPAYKKAEKAGRLGNNWWEHTQGPYHQIDFYVWAMADDDPGVRHLYVGKALERARHYMHALKAYYAGMVLYPDSVSASASGQFEYSTAEASWNSIMNLIRRHPELNVRLVDANVTTTTDQSGVHIVVDPGRLEIIPEAQRVDISELHEFELPRISLVKHRNDQWTLLVDGSPYLIKGVTYDPTAVGEVPWEHNWMWADDDTNGIVDVEETYIDANTNNMQDADEPTVGDFKILSDMGCNTIRTYNTNINVLLMRRMYKEYGIRVILGDFLGAYVINSGATWEDGTDYTDPTQRERMKAAVMERVLKYRHEPWLLAWVLGNENNMPSTTDVNTTRTNANAQPEAYASFLNEVADLIHELDPHHPVGVGNMLVGLVEYYGKHAPALDFIGINAYIGPDGFGSIWNKVKEETDKPVLITEYGCDAYWTGRGPDEQAQADYHMGCWNDILYNSAGYPGEGNSIGGCVFEFLDEWWKDTRNYFEDPTDHQSVKPTTDMAFPDGKSQEEWLGIVGQGDGTGSPFLRMPRKAYFAYQRAWLDGEEDVDAE